MEFGVVWLTLRDALGGVLKVQEGKCRYHVLSYTLIIDKSCKNISLWEKKQQ